MTNIITFNTGRWYGPKGQRIAAMRTDQGGFLFYDVDRGITGYIPFDYVSEHGLQLDQSTIMDVYDHQRVNYWATPLDVGNTLRCLKYIAENLAPDASQT